MSMFSNDYLMKMIAQFIRALSEIIRYRKEKNYEEALVHIKATSLRCLGTDIENLLKYSPDEIVNYFKGDAEKNIMAAELIHELAHICDANEVHAESTHLKKLSLSLYMEAIPNDKQFQTEEYKKKATDLIHLLNNDLSSQNQNSLNRFKTFMK
jgi:hypothetical protein